MDPRDHIEIQQLYAAYAHTMDGGDFAGWAGLFTPDGVWDRVDRPGGEVLFAVAGRADLEAFAREDHAGRGAGMARHWTGNILLEGEAPEVHGRTYLFLIQSIEGSIQWIAHGDFTDTIVRLDEGWRFARRSVAPLGELTLPSEASAPPS
jgi:hypothetical protein